MQTSDHSAGRSIRAALDRRKAPRFTIDQVVESNLLLSLACAIPAVLTTLLLAVLTSPTNPYRNPLFDASPSLLGTKDASLIRWDAIHFLSVASDGYQYEQQLAFQPGWHAVLHVVGRVWQSVFRTARLQDAITRGSIPLMWILAGIRGCLLFGSVQTSPYGLWTAADGLVWTCRLTETVISRRVAVVSTLFYLLAPTPAVLVSPYTEPLYACFTFAGYLLAYQRQFLLASLCLAGATSLRATGIFAAPLLAALAIFPHGLTPLPSMTVSHATATSPQSFD